MFKGFWPFWYTEKLVQTNDNLNEKIKFCLSSNYWLCKATILLKKKNHNQYSMNVNTLNLIMFTNSLKILNNCTV